MRVLKVVAEGITTSFRYPHFMQGIHPSFEMPPPATIYGHVCSALGEWFDPSGVLFAYHFTHEGKCEDVEHIHVLAPEGGKLKGTDIPKVLGGAVNPFKREIFFKPRLTLYLNKPEWASAFRSPHYAVALGRSQDLFTYTSVAEIELERAEGAYFEHTLAPYQASLMTATGYVALMPRFLDYYNNRRPTFARYVILKRRVTELMQFEGLPKNDYWIDPTAPRVQDLPLGLWFHSWTGEYDDAPRMA
ncbi:MAG: type I-B CRISPR-associated protein Cas5 [Chloroflexi bacterium UTCFX4]|jgi:CRISPR-associated protein Cas5t|nr:MAG: type I-B CRISPR-associated protein Cas5 [Chloroflexi bacterium UTCFX4]